MMVDYKKIAQLWENTQDVEIYLNMELLRSVVQSNTDKWLK